MRFALPAIVLCLLAAPAAAAPGPRPPVKAKLVECEPALDAESRRATFEGDMRGIPGAVRLQIKFVLQVRARERRRWRTAAAPGFGVWNVADPGVGRYVYTKTVESLAAPGRYRAAVHFRWVAGDGRTVLRATRHTRTCHQPDLRPQLTVRGFERTGSAFSVFVVNRGGSDAAPFAVSVDWGGRSYRIGQLTELRAGAGETVTGEGPPCRPGEPLTVRLDPDDVVDERVERDNVLHAVC